MVQVEDCPKCLGISEVMEPKEKTGFEYKKCSLCGGRGLVASTIAEDYVEANKVFENDAAFIDDSFN